MSKYKIVNAPNHSPSTVPDITAEDTIVLLAVAVL